MAAAEEGRGRRGFLLVNLPQEILEEVLSRLPLNVIGRCMLLSKRIYSVITSDTFYERWIGANLRPELIIFSEADVEDVEEGEEGMMNSIDTLDLGDFDQPQLPDRSGFVEILNPLDQEVDSEAKIIVHGSAKGLLLLQVKKEEQRDQLHIWNPFLRLLGPAITLPQGFDGQHELQVGFGHSNAQFHVLLISPLVEGEPAGLLTLQGHLLTMATHLENQAWTLVTCPVQLSSGSVLCLDTRNALNDETVLWSVRDGTTHWSIQGFSFATKSFIPNISFPVWQGDGARNLPIVKILGGRVYAYRRAAGVDGDADPVVLWRLEDGDWGIEACFNMMYDFPEEVCDIFKEVVAVTNERGRLFVYTSDDHLIGYDPSTNAYFFFGDRGIHYGAIDDNNYPQLPELRVVAYHPSLIWPYSRFAGEDI